jgi:GNAT superfamily N-acetyltransferase
MVPAPPLEIRFLVREDLPRIGEVDRSEHVTLAYGMDGGRLRERPVDWRIPDWSPEGEGEHSLSRQIAFCRDHLDRRGVMLGAFREDRLVGTALVQVEFRETLAQLAFFYVDREVRRQGVAGRLFKEVLEITRASEARAIYVSAIPSASAVGFYLSRGFRPVPEPDPELYALEPDDIHMVRDLQPARLPGPGGGPAC